MNKLVASPRSAAAERSSRQSSKSAAPCAAEKTPRTPAKAAKPTRAVSPSSTRKPARPAAKDRPAHDAARKATAARNARPAASAKPKLLAGGNPQIAKGDGDAPVQAYIAAMPGWKSDVGRRLDTLIERTVPGVHKAVKWNSPFYGADDEGWVLNFHCFEKYIKVAFFRGASLRPVPPVESKLPETRYVHIHEGDAFDDEQLAAWVKQASRLPSVRM
jgi:hypothetical protein